MFNKMLSVLSMLSKLGVLGGRGVLGGGEGEGGNRLCLLNKGGGNNRLPCLVTKQQAVEFPQVQTSSLIIG